MKLLLYVAALLPLNYLMAAAPWGSAYLSVVIVLTYFCWRPARVFHPNNMLFGFYGLYVVLSSTLNLILSAIDWEYVLPWGQTVFWDTFSPYLLFQAELTFLALFFGFHLFCHDDQTSPPTIEPVKLDSTILLAAWVTNLVLVAWFIQSTAGLSAWLNDYSATYLEKREGHGALNFVLLTAGNAAVFLFGLNVHQARRKGMALVFALPVLFLQAYVNGFKGRFLFLLILFLSPWLLSMKLRARTLVGFVVAFFVLLYLATLVRTEGYYASAPFFLEMLIGYFNAFQLHDWIVTSRDPDLFQTVLQVFTKPMQVLGLVDKEADFDLSVMLTKEYFPEQWDLEHATQQWPLDTELYLNWYGPWLGWLPVLVYAAVIAKIYRRAVLHQHLALLPIFVLEFQRIFSVLRGTLIPWEIFVLVVQYLAIYGLCRWCIRPAPTLSHGEAHG